jgi:MFS family permease
MFCSTFMSSVYSSGYKQIMEKYHVSSSVSLLGVSLFCLGLAFGPMIAAPLSETAGRLTIYRLSLPIAALFVLGSAVSDSLASILICRFFAGFFGSPALSVGSGTIADIWRPESRTRATAFFVLAPNLGPSLGITIDCTSYATTSANAQRNLGPVIGGFVQQSKGWRWLEWVSVFLAILTYVWALGMRETYRKTILGKFKKAPMKSSSHLPSHEKPRASEAFDTLKSWIAIYMGRPMAMLVTEPVVGFLSLYVALNFGILYNFFPAIPWSLSRTYGFNEGQSGLAFLGIAIGCLLAGATCVGFDWYLKRKPRHSKTADSNYLEQSLWPAMVGSLGGPVALFWFAWTVRSDISWASPVCALIPFAWGNLCIFVSILPFHPFLSHVHVLG